MNKQDKYCRLAEKFKNREKIIGTTMILFKNSIILSVLSCPNSIGIGGRKQALEEICGEGGCLLPTYLFRRLSLGCKNWSRSEGRGQSSGRRTEELMEA